MESTGTVLVACDDGQSTTAAPAEHGDQMTMTLWEPPEGGPAILLLQEIFGVGGYLRSVAARLAESGYVVGAPDVFWRFAPGWAADHDEHGLNSSLEQVGHLDPRLAIHDCVAALDTLAERPGVHGMPAVLGFCLGGTLALGVAIEADPSVCVSYYGSGVPDMIDQLDGVTCPTLFHFGREDPYLPAAGIEALAHATIERPNLVINVEAAGHAFDNHESELFYVESAARAAWAKTMAFLGQHFPVR